MKSALRWTRWVLLGDIAIIAVLMLVLTVASLVDVDIQPYKWPTMFYGGILVILAIALSISALALQVIVAMKRRWETH